MVWASILSAQDSNGILRFNGVGGIDVKKSQAEREKNCKASIENQVNLNFNTTYKVMGKINSLRLSSLPANKGNAKISTIGDISYDETAEMCTAKLELDIPEQPIYTRKVAAGKPGFVDADTYILQYSMKLDKNSGTYYLSYLSCLHPKQLFKKLIQSVSSEEIKEDKNISLTFAPGSIFSRCDLAKKEDKYSCDCLVIFHKKDLKQEITKQ